MCLSPIPVWRSPSPNENGKYPLLFSPPSLMDSRLWPYGNMTVPCGKCLGCRDDIRKQWVKRLRLEMFSHSAWFVTLTYNDENLPACGCLVIHIQKFLKRVRNIPRDYGVPFLGKFRYFFCSEYGLKHGRAHYHGILYGLDLNSLEFRYPNSAISIATSKVDSRGRTYPVFTSTILSRCWNSRGFVSVGECTSATCKYVAKYICKGDFGKPRPDGKNPTFRLFSRGLGDGLFLNGSGLPRPFLSSCWSSGVVLDRDSKFPSQPPKFIYSKLKDLLPDLYESVRSSRRKFAKSRKNVLDVCRASDAYKLQVANSMKGVLDNDC